jgi:hypothetical protein
MLPTFGIIFSAYDFPMTRLAQINNPISSALLTFLAILSDSAEASRWLRDAVATPSDIIADKNRIRVLLPKKHHRQKQSPLRSPCSTVRLPSPLRQNPAKRKERRAAKHPATGNAASPLRRRSQ